jgi:hypothetical protein
MQIKHRGVPLGILGHCYEKETGLVMCIQIFIQNELSSSSEFWALRKLRCDFSEEPDFAASNTS